MNKKLFIIALAAFAFFSLFTFAPAARAQGGEPPAPITDDQVNAIAQKMYCPVCENIPLDVCPTQACAQWRETIREKLAAGWSEQQILDYFVQQYGERVLAQPSTRGLNLFIWLIPPLALLFGAVFLWRYLKRAERRTVPGVASALPPNDKYTAMLEKELARRR